MSDNSLSKGLLDVLVCPISKANLIYDAEHSELISVQARLAYPVRDGIPILLPNQARALSPLEVTQLRQE